MGFQTKPHFEVYPRKDGGYGWRFVATNNRITAIGGEGFTRRDDANRAIHDFFASVTGEEPHPPIFDVDE